MLRFSKLRNKQYLSFVCNFNFFFIFYSWVVNTQCWTEFHYYCCDFSQIGRFFLFNYGLCSYGKLFWEKFKKRLINGQRSTLKNKETVSVWKLVIFKKLQCSPLITVSNNRILRVATKEVHKKRTRTSLHTSDPLAPVSTKKRPVTNL